MKVRMACQNPLSPSISCQSILSPSPRFLSRPSPRFLSRPSPRFLSRHHVSSSLRAFTPPSARRLSSPNFLLDTKLHCSYPHKPLTAPNFSPRVTKTVEYIFPDPIPEFAEAETIKFRAHLLERLSKKDIFDDSLEEIVCICTEILSNFLHAEYGGPGTLLVVPFIDMADTINERGLPGGPQAARAAVVWAQKHIDNDWKDWTGDPNL